jgi:toxin ParE1/3/4
MSSPKYRLVLSPKAEHDIENILRYTGETWGEKQLTVYRHKIADALDKILATPGCGHLSADLPDTHRLHPAGSHVVIYRMKESVVEVIRIVHKRMSLPRQLE